MTQDLTIETTIAAPAPTSDAVQKRATPRAKYTEAFITKVKAQAHPHPMAIDFGGAAPSDATMLLRALVSCDMPHRLVDTVVGLADGDTEAYLLGGITKLTPEAAASVFYALHKIKTNKLEHIRGADQLSLLTMVYTSPNSAA